MYSLKKKIDFILIPAVNPLIETSYVADGVLCLLTWCWHGTDVAIKILFKKLFGIF